MEKTFNTGLLNLNFVESSQGGSPLLLLHGLFTKWKEFNPIISEFEHHHIFAPDLRGHGKSDRTKAYNIQDFSNDTASFINDYIKQPTTIFGHSLGGMIGIMVAALKPELVKALIIGDSLLSKESVRAFSQFHEQKTIWWRKLAETKSIETIITELKNELMAVPNSNDLIPARKILGEEHPSFYFFAECISQCDPNMLSANIDHIEDIYTEYNLNELLPKIQCPVLIIQGNPELGGILSDGEVERALALLPTAKHIKIKTAGHFLHLQDKDSVLRAVIPFLKSCDKI